MAKKPEKVSFANLYFGKSDSKNELNGQRDEFIRSFVDLKNITQQVIEGERTLVLGPKGTGKSALAWFLDASKLGSNYLTKVLDASLLPLADIPRLDTGQPAGADRTVSAWKFILLCNYLALLLSDESSDLPARLEVDRVVRLLRRYGFTGDTAGRAIINATTTTVEIPLPKIGNVYRRESKSSLNIFNLLPYMEEWAAGARSANRHVLLLDGLDSIFLNDSKYDESLASLVQAAYSINQNLGSVGASGSIVLLLRHDVFNRVSLILPDSQKMRDDHSVELDWRVMSGAAGARAPLVQLVNQKAGQAAGLQSIDVLSYFPQYITIGGGNGDAPRYVERLQYLLNLTRHTPRDLLRLMDEIRKVEGSGIFPPSGATLRPEVIREGVIQYSSRYFTGAIRNEFAGYEHGTEEATRALTALQSMPRQSFDRKAFVDRLSQTGDAHQIVVDRLLTLLFYAGAIGNVVAVKGGSYLQFYHRRDDAQIYLNGQFMIHNALCHAWSLPFSS